MKEKILLIGFLGCLGLSALRAGNPDRQGEAGAYQLLMVPWARTSGLHLLNTSNIGGVEAMRLNIAGLTGIRKLQVAVGHAIYFSGTDIHMNAAGLATKIGKNGTLGISLMALDFGDIVETTALQPEGTGITFSPSFFNMGIGYAHQFADRISVGVLVRGISESSSNISAFGIAIDAGIQYKTGNFQFGVSLRNIGSRMTYGGEALGEQLATASSFNGPITLTFNRRSDGFELPTVLNIGMSYDIRMGEQHRITALGNFTANAFSRDDLGVGLEYAFEEYLQLRAGYRIPVGDVATEEESIYTGLAAGVSVGVPLGRRSKGTWLAVDYAYRQTRVFAGTHNIGLRFNL